MTFHVRLVSPGDLTEHLVDVLLANSGVSNLVVLTGSARRPDGDAVQFDVPARSANVVLRQLEAFVGDRRGSISIESLDATIGEEATPPPRRRLVQRDMGAALLGEPCLCGCAACFCWRRGRGVSAVSLVVRGFRDG